MGIEPLQHYKVVDKDGLRGTLRCPRSGCGGEFTVDRKQFKKQKFATAMRTCPYCCRVAIVPGQRIPDYFDKAMVPDPF